MKLLCFILPFFLLNVMGCIFVAESTLNLSQEGIKRDLEVRGYKFFSKRINYQSKEQVDALQLNKNGQYAIGDFEKICSILNLNEVYFDSIDIFGFNKREVESCSRSAINRFSFSGVNLNNKEFCNLVKKIKTPKVNLDFTRVNLDDQDIVCFSEIENLDIFVSEKSANFSDDSFCKFSSNAKKLGNVKNLSQNVKSSPVSR